MNQFLKTVFKLGIFLIICQYYKFSNAQGVCATEITSNQVSYINNTQIDRSTIDVSHFSTNTIEIPVVAHIIETDDENPTNTYSSLSEVELTDAIAVLNNGFLNAGFNFTLCEINTLSGFNEVYYSPYPESGNEYLLAANTSKKRALNIYFVSEAFDLNGQSVCGWSSFPSEYHQYGKNWIVIKKDCATNESTLIHEVGHFFNLYHTHQRKNVSLGITEAELADDSNCGAGIGDEVCDTPAEPYRSGNGINGIVNEDCIILCEYKDLKDNTYHISNGETNYNYMSYAPYKCRNHFTSDQINRMKVSYLIDRSYLSETCPNAIVIENNNSCDIAQEKRALIRISSVMNAPYPVNNDMDWPGVSYNANNGCVIAIDWSDSELTGNIPYEFEDLKHLESLNLSNNTICGTISENISNLRKLQVLNLSNNQISGSIPGDIELLEDLVMLNLSSNNLCGYVPYQLSNLNILTDLSLINNNFSGCIHPSLQDLCDNLPISICSNCNKDDWDAIKSIYKNMGGANTPMMNQISPDLFQDENGDFLTHPPANCDLGSIQFITINEYGRIKSLWLSNYGLTGTLPSDVEKLADLRDLLLNYNNLSGYLPSSLGNLTKLTSAQFNYNNLNNKLPVNITKLCDQAILNLANNSQIEGNLYRDFCDGKRGYVEEVADYVMPGDFNNDKKVNNMDLIFWSNAYDEIGEERLDAHIAWLPQYCNNWNGFSHGINHKHQDANGDGKICKKDLEAFRLNFGKGAENNVFDQSGSNEANFYLDLIGDGLNGFYISIKKVGNGNENINSLIFTLDMSSINHNGVFFDYTDIEEDKQPIAEEVHSIEGSNLIEVALSWSEGNPPPIDDPFGRMIIAVEANSSEGSASLRIGNVQISSNGFTTSLGGLDIDAFDASNEADACINQYVSNSLDVSKDYFAPDSIVSPREEDQQAYVNGCTTVTFNSGRYVLLNPGFKNQHGTVFCAQIGGEAWEEACINPKYNALLPQQEIIIYPNPTQNQATIELDLAEESTINLTLTDMTGKKLQTILNKSNKPEGIHQIEIDTSKLPTGVYFCNLHSNDVLSTKKLIVVK